MSKERRGEIARLLIRRHAAKHEVSVPESLADKQAIEFWKDWVVKSVVPSLERDAVAMYLAAATVELKVPMAEMLEFQQWTLQCILTDIFGSHIGEKENFRLAEFWTQSVLRISDQFK